jgi:hypothetical protein
VKESRLAPNALKHRAKKASKKSSPAGGLFFPNRIFFYRKLIHKQILFIGNINHLSEIRFFSLFSNFKACLPVGSEG